MTLAQAREHLRHDRAKLCEDCRERYDRALKAVKIAERAAADAARVVTRPAGRASRRVASHEAGHVTVAIASGAPAPAVTVDGAGGGITWLHRAADNFERSDPPAIAVAGAVGEALASRGDTAQLRSLDRLYGAMSSGDLEALKAACGELPGSQHAMVLMGRAEAHIREHRERFDAIRTALERCGSLREQDVASAWRHPEVWLNG